MKKTGLFLGPTLFLLFLIFPAPHNLSSEAWYTAAIGCLMAVWWITEAIPIAATALIPLVLFPITGIAAIKPAAAPYANPLIFLFMGGFVVALGIQRWHLHKRMALEIIRSIGMKPRSIIAGFMIATAFLSMWVSNTATAMMMLPIALSIVEVAKSSNNDKDLGNFSVVLLLSIAYSASIGGLGTLIGTPPNALMAAFLNETYGFQMDFVKWMIVGVPLVIIGVFLSYLLLVYVIYPIRINSFSGGKNFIKSELAKMGKMSANEIKVAVVFALVALLWIIRPLLQNMVPGISDTGIAILGALLMFLVPADWNNGEFLLDWKDMQLLPWGVLLLFGGGLSLASAISSTGLSVWIGTQLSQIQYPHIIIIVFIITACIILLTELTSNTATTAAFLPIMASVAVSIGQDPLLFVVPTAIAASCAFMLPVATPPNAIIYGSGTITIPKMARAGIFLNILFVMLITLFTFTLVVLVFNIKIN